MTEVVVIGEDGSQEFMTWGTGSDRLAYQRWATVTVRDSEPARVVGDFRRLPERVWQSPHGQEVRVFMPSPDIWQWTVDGMDVTGGQLHSTVQDARDHAHACTDRYPYAEYPMWDGE